MLPIFVENSKVPVWLSKVSPIEINAISLGLFVFSRGPMGSTTRRHETIHYRQWLELGFVFFPLLYGLFWLRNRLKGMDGVEAYYKIPFEQEAYTHDRQEGYLKSRKLYQWIYFV